MRNTLILFLALSLLSCNNVKKPAESTPINKVVAIPAFSADSAYKYVKAQVDFGPRMPNTKQHDECANYLEQQLKQFGAQVTVQRADLTAFDGKVLKSENIIGSYNPEAQNRILLFAHWDTRPWADNDPNPKNHNTPILGANDGASGVGVLLEIARNLGKEKPNIGVDIIFFDMEDYGTVEGGEDSWCLGTQYWAMNLPTSSNKPKFGILLDMVGAPNATFYKEQFSQLYAPDIVEKVWSQAAALGLGQTFVDEQGGAITDDHIYVNKLAGIPSIDIIQFDKNTSTGFAAYWHTVDDTMANVDKTTLQAVGVTLLNVIYNE